MVGHVIRPNPRTAPLEKFITLIDKHKAEPTKKPDRKALADFWVSNKLHHQKAAHLLYDSVPRDLRGEVKSMTIKPI